MPGFQPNKNLTDIKTTGKKSKKVKGGEMKRDISANAPEFSGKVKNNFFRDDFNPTTNELQDILSRGGVSDINIKKQMLINKIKNNEIDPDKYMKFIDAVSQDNEPDEEALDFSKKNSKNKKKPSTSNTAGPMPVVNFNYNSYIKIGAYPPPPVINTLIVNGKKL